MALHHHHHHDHHAEVKNLRTAFFLNFFFAILEGVGGIYVNSMAVVSNALHDVGDSLALGLSWYFSIVSGKGRSSAFSYGYRRFSLLSALIGGVVLFIGSSLILYNAVPRLFHPEESQAGGMLLFALVGVGVNAIAAWRLKGGGSMNEKMMMMHLLEDVLGWAAVLVASIVLFFAKVPQLDPVLAIVITLIILWNAGKNLKGTVMIFLQGVPEGIDLDEMERKMLEIEGVKGVHDLHVWTLDGSHDIATLHLVVERPIGLGEAVELKTKIREITAKYAISHATIEFEFGEKDCMVHDHIHRE